MTIWFSSDHHFSHKNIITYCDRPFDDVDDMNRSLVANWNAIVKPTDTVFYLGDFSLRTAAVEEFAPRLNGSKILIAGNHDACHSCNASFKSQMSFYRKFFDDIYEELEWNDFLLHHMPYSDKDDDRYPEHRPFDQGKILIHGHVHQRWTTNGRQINVGVDVWNYEPVSESTISGLAREIEELTYAE